MNESLMKTMVKNDCDLDQAIAIQQRASAGATREPQAHEARCSVASGSVSVMDEYMRLDKIIRDCEETRRIAERLKATGRWQSKWDSELADLDKKLDSTLRERDWLDGALSRYASSQNAKALRSGGTEGVQ